MAPPKPNTALRLLVPLILLGIGVFAAWAVMVNTSRSAAPGQQDPASPAFVPGSPIAADDQPLPADDPVLEPADGLVAEQIPPAGVPAADAPADQPAMRPTDQPEDLPEDLPEDRPDNRPDDPTEINPGAQTEPETADEAAVTFAARRHGAGVPYTELGSIDPDAASRLRIEFSPIGAGVRSIRLAGQFNSVAERTEYRTTGQHDPDDHVQVQAEQTNAQGEVVTPFAALWAEIDGTIVGLAAPGIWRELAPGRFEAVIETDAGEPVVRIERAYTVDDGSLDVMVAQRVENLSAEPRTVRLITFGPIDLAQDAVTYGGDKRRVRFGYLLRPELDPTRSVVLAKKYLTPRHKVIGSAETRRPDRQIWPDETSVEGALELVWSGLTNRYFAVAVHGTVDNDPATPDLTFESVERIDRVLLENRVAGVPTDPTLILRLASPEATLGPTGTADLSFRFYAGPKHEPTIAQSPAALAAGVDEIVVYNFGGPCAPCTFTWLTGPLIALLRFLHGIIPDWSIAMILLVFVVRGILHPVNRWSQIRVQRFGKQMQDMAPKQKKIQEKYKDDKQRMQQEMAKLWREEGVNPAGMLGCLPMLLQSPVWIALYASLYFLYDLRHEPAFFGLIQSITGGNWLFLADLAEPDHFITLPEAARFNVPLMGLISSFNILPLVLAVVYFIHMKFLTPPTSATLTPEQESTQKIAKYMTVILFPVIMYNAPSGLAIYFIANSTTAILENTWIRAHIKKHDLLEVKKKPRKTGGFIARLQAAAEQQQQLRQQRMQGGQPGMGHGGKPGKGGESAAQRAIRRGQQSDRDRR